MLRIAAGTPGRLPTALIPSAPLATARLATTLLTSPRAAATPPTSGGAPATSIRARRAPAPCVTRNESMPTIVDGRVTIAYVFTASRLGAAPSFTRTSVYDAV